MCNLLQHFCERELQHRVEAIVAFSERHVERLQRDQRRRYAQLMRALTMSAAETARRTREFRSPPQEQVGAWGHPWGHLWGLGTPMRMAWRCGDTRGDWGHPWGWLQGMGMCMGTPTGTSLRHGDTHGDACGEWGHPWGWP